MIFLSKRLVFSLSSGSLHVPIARISTPAAWHMVQHHLILLGNYLWIYLCAFKLHLFAFGWCLHTFFLRDKGEDSATLSESLWTLRVQLKRSRVVFSNPMYFAVFLQCAVTENLIQVYNL